MPRCSVSCTLVSQSSRAPSYTGYKTGICWSRSRRGNNWPAPVKAVWLLGPTPHIPAADGGNAAPDELVLFHAGLHVGWIQLYLVWYVLPKYKGIGTWRALMLTRIGTLAKGIGTMMIQAIALTRMDIRSSVEEWNLKFQGSVSERAHFLIYVDWMIVAIYTISKRRSYCLLVFLLLYRYYFRTKV